MTAVTDQNPIIPEDVIRSIAPDATDIESRRLTGGVSASMFVVSWTDLAGQTDRAVVRRRETGFGELTVAQGFR